MYLRSIRLPLSRCTLANEDELVQKVRCRMQSRVGGQVRGFEISICKEGCVLKGNVGTYYGKLMAQEVVAEVSGLSILANDIEVLARS